MKRNYDYVRRAYGVDPIIGQRVYLEESRKHGTVARPGSAGHYVYVTFDGVKFATPCHPTSLTYYPLSTEKARP